MRSPPSNSSPLIPINRINKYIKTQKRLVTEQMVPYLPKTTTENLLNELKAKKLPVQEEHRMYQPISKKLYELVLVVLNFTLEGKTVDNLKSPIE